MELGLGVESSSGGVRNVFFSRQMKNKALCPEKYTIYLLISVYDAVVHNYAHLYAVVCVNRYALRLPHSTILVVD